MKRLAQTQLWPELSKRDIAPISAARPRSASANTMNASLPPSSKTPGFIAAPASAATVRPAAVLPVSVTARTRGSAMSAGTAVVSISSD
jgi:hypothetical protein